MKSQPPVIVAMIAASIQSPIRRKMLAMVVVGVASIAASAHAANDRLRQRRSERDLAAMTAALDASSGGITSMMTTTPAATSSSDGARRVVLNGGEMMVRKSVEPQSLDDAMAKIASECASGDAEVAIGLGPMRPTGLRDGQPKVEAVLERIATEESASGDVRASLCIFAPDDSHDRPRTRVRYTLARRVDTTTTSITTIARLSTEPLAVLFPADGDAPGSDLAEVARPERSRRLLTAILGDGGGGGRGSGAANEYSARMYESSLPVEEAVQSYDVAMTARGFVTTASLPDARMYRRRNAAPTEPSFAASFRATTEGSTVVIAASSR